MDRSLITVPGYRGSRPAHWQTWLEAQRPDARRVTGIDWEAPILARWAASVRQQIDDAPTPVLLVAHSFGCLASVIAAADRPEKVAGLLLVAPADPQRFSPLGLRHCGEGPAVESVADCLPDTPLASCSLLVASADDPWMRADDARAWAETWGSRFIDIGRAGHINAESGFGPWPQALELLESLRAWGADHPLGGFDTPHGGRRGRYGALARLRHTTRRLLNSLPRTTLQP